MRFPVIFLAVKSSFPAICLISSHPNLVKKLWVVPEADFFVIPRWTLYDI